VVGLEVQKEGRDRAPSRVSCESQALVARATLGPASVSPWAQ
jgi:hypothetical protein